MSTQSQFDIAIFGGGIAGLWLLARLRAAGYRALLLERDALGGVQTIASQGIIHGGTKYALTGQFSESARAIGEMPGIWRAALDGIGELDLRGVRVLADHQLLWSTEGLASRLTGFFAGKAMRSRMAPLERSAHPDLFRNSAFRGDLYRLEEPVLDLPSLVARLVELGGDAFAQVDGTECEFVRTDDGVEIWSPKAQLLDSKIIARGLVLVAGAGNGALLERLGRRTPAMQVRPLHMVMVRGRLPLLFAHCLGAGSNPRLTVTAYPLGEEESVWYLGGQIAESGVGRSETEQIEVARRELAELLPWLDQAGLEWATWRVDRAEPRTLTGSRPDACFVEQAGAVITAWPTKLAFAPRLAAEIMVRLARDGIDPSGEAEPALPMLPRPPLAKLPWEQVVHWH